MLRLFYNLLFPVAFGAMLPGIVRRLLRRGNHRPGFGQRFGFYAPEVRRRLAEGAPRPWIQAVSVGEMFVALKLIAALRDQCPGVRLVLSATTTTGLQLARERAGPEVEVVYTPIDSWGSIRRAYDVLRPSHLVIVDGGLWPNALWEARRRGVPTALASARLSPRSERRFRRFGRLTRPVFGLLDLVCVPETGEIERWVGLGVEAGRIVLTGNVKFDDPAPSAKASPAKAPQRSSPAACLAALGVTADRPVLLAASTHAGEERLVAEAFQEVRRRHPGFFLVVAPRHAERAPEVGRELAALGLRVAWRSAPAPGVFDALLLDTTGELREWPAVASAVFIGKSITATGGQNPAEAAAAGRPALFGPHMENFQPLAAELVKAGAAIPVSTAQNLAARLEFLLGNPAVALAAGEAGRRTLAIHRGAARRTAEELVKRGGFSPCL